VLLDPVLHDLAPVAHRRQVRADRDGLNERVQAVLQASGAPTGRWLAQPVLQLAGVSHRISRSCTYTRLLSFHT